METKEEKTSTPSTSTLSISFVFTHVISFLRSLDGVTSLQRLLCTSKQFVIAFEQYQTLPLWNNDSTCNPSNLLESFALHSWPNIDLRREYSDVKGMRRMEARQRAGLPHCNPNKWQDTRSHTSETLVPATSETRVSHLNGQTLRGRGTYIISVGRKKTSIHNVHPNHRSSQEIQISQEFPLIQAAIHSSGIFWGARKTYYYSDPISSGNFLTTSNNTLLPDPIYNPKQHATIPKFFGCDFLPETEPTLIIGCSNNTTGSYSTPDTAPSCWLETHRITPDGACKLINTWKNINLDQCKGGVMAPLFRSSVVCTVGREHISLYDTRSNNQTCSVSLKVVRRSMGASGPARACISPEGTYICAIMDRSINVYDFRCDRIVNRQSDPIVSMNFVADQVPMACCWMPPKFGFSIGSGNSTGDVVIHDVSTGTHTDTLFNQLRAACVSLATYDGGIVSQNAVGTVNMHV